MYHPNQSEQNQQNLIQMKSSSPSYTPRPSSAKQSGILANTEIDHDIHFLYPIQNSRMKKQAESSQRNSIRDRINQTPKNQFPRQFNNLVTPYSPVNNLSHFEHPKTNEKNHTIDFINDKLAGNTPYRVSLNVPPQNSVYSSRFNITNQRPPSSDERERKIRFSMSSPHSSYPQPNQQYIQTHPSPPQPQPQPQSQHQNPPTHTVPHYSQPQLPQPQVQPSLSQLNTSFQSLFTMNQKMILTLQSLTSSINILNSKIQYLSNQNVQMPNNQPYERLLKKTSFESQKSVEEIDAPRQYLQAEPDKDSGQVVKFPQFTDYRYENLKIPKNIYEILGSACKVIFNTGFGLLRKGELDSNKVKVFCSEQLLKWTIEKSRSIFSINQQLQTHILPYFNEKYQASEEEGVNMELSSMIVERKNIDDNENDFFNKNGIIFRKSDDGYYDSNIMKWINILITKTKEIVNQQQPFDSTSAIFSKAKNSNQSLFEHFHEDMKSIFKKVENKHLVQEMSRFSVSQNFLKQVTSDFAIKNILSTELEPSVVSDKKQEQEYREYVKSYTKFQIGQKLKPTLRQFSKKQIENSDFDLSDSGLIRMLIKWTEQLEECFEQKSILEREQPFRMRTGTQSFLSKSLALLLFKLLRRQRPKLQQCKSRIRKKHRESQNSLPQQQRSFHYTTEEMRVGLFATELFKSYQAYLKRYLNLLIDSICLALNQFQSILSSTKTDLTLELIQAMDEEGLEQVVKQAQSALKLFDVSNLVPELIKFTIGDLFRCKCSSKQKQITALYKQFERLSRLNDKMFKIVRIKNRLKKETKDILINAMYRDKLLVQIQLAVKSDKTEFIEDSYKFKHFIYELSRSKFGPIHEMANIWVSKDPRAQIYLEYFEQNNWRQDKSINVNLSGQEKKIDLPFRCDNCLYFYEDPKVQDKHVTIEGLSICNLCAYESQSEFNDELIYLRKGFKNINFSAINQYLEGGKIINIRNDEKRSFIRVNKSNHVYLIELVDKGKSFQLIAKFEVGQIMALKKFLVENFIQNQEVELDQELYQNKHDLYDRIQQTFFMPAYINQRLKYQKNSITLNSKKLTSADFLPDSHESYDFVKRLNLSDNQIVSLDKVAYFFPKLKILNLDNNNLSSKGIVTLANLQCLQRLSLNENESLEKVPLQIFKLSKMESLELKGCKIRELIIPQIQTTSLKVLRLDKTSLKEIPREISRFAHLEILSLSKIGLKQLPKQLSQLRSLKYLNISENPLFKIPEFIGEIDSLETLEANKIILTSLPESLQNIKRLRVLNLNFNKITKFDSLCKIISLEKLYLSHNQIKEIPKSIVALKSLKEMSLDNNDKALMIIKEILKMENLVNLYTTDFSSKTKYKQVKKQGLEDLLKQCKRRSERRENISYIPARFSQIPGRPSETTYATGSYRT